jgi:hypothetical protein
MSDATTGRNGHRPTPKESFMANTDRPHNPAPLDQCDAADAVLSKWALLSTLLTPMAVLEPVDREALGEMLRADMAVLCHVFHALDDLRRQGAGQ